MLRASVISLFCCLTAIVHGARTVRLSGSLIPLEGRVEVYNNGEWGTVCSNGWNIHTNNKDVVCKELGYNQGRAISHEYPGIGKIWLDGVVCSADERSIIDCTHKSWGDTTCTHDQDVTVQCDICKRPIISSVEYLVFDWSFSASGYRDGNLPHHARIRSTRAWCLPEVINTELNHYLEVELPRLYLVSAVATLGGVTYSEYVTSYRAVYSVDGNEWKNATVNGKQVIKGNTKSGNDDVQTRILDNAIRARFLRFMPMQWASVACMRVDICGHQLPHYPTVIVKVDITSARLSWSIPNAGDEAIKKYNVRYWKSKQDKSFSRVFESTATSDVVLSNLSPYTKYLLEISGVSDLGEGMARVSQFKTLETVPSGSPTSVSFKFLGETAVNISWSPPDEDKRNGDIIAYIVCFPSTGCKDPISIPSPQTWYVLHGDLRTQREVEIRAQTAKGSGPVARATTGVVKTTSSENTNSSVIIAIIFGMLFLALLIIALLASKGIILKNFVETLRNLMSSRMTVSSRSDYDKTYPYPVVDAHTRTTAENLYNNENIQNEKVLENLSQLRKQATVSLSEEIYARKTDIGYGNSGNTLYNTQDTVGYDSRGNIVYNSRESIVYNSRENVVYDSRDQIVYNTRGGISHEPMSYSKSNENPIYKEDNSYNQSVDDLYQTQNPENEDPYGRTTTYGKSYNMDPSHDIYKHNASMEHTHGNLEAMPSNDWHKQYISQEELAQQYNVENPYIYRAT